MKKNAAIRILVVDDHYVVRFGLSGSINVDPGMSVVAEASTGEQALVVYREQQPDVVLLDLRLPGLSGLDTARALLAEFADAKIIMLSTYDGDEDIYRAFQSGVKSYLLKTAQREELLEAIRAVHAGQRFVTPAVALRLAERAPCPDLSDREMQVLGAIAKGKSNKEIGAALSIAEVTVKLHASSIFNKLGVNDRTQAVTTALQRGILHLDDPL